MKVPVWESLVPAGGERHGKVNMVQILFTHVCKWKMRPIETTPGMGEIKKNNGGGEFKYNIFNIL
jgi:hypothetical protein